MQAAWVCFFADTAMARPCGGACGCVPLRGLAVHRRRAGAAMCGRAPCPLAGCSSPRAPAARGLARVRSASGLAGQSRVPTRASARHDGYQATDLQVRWACNMRLGVFNPTYPMETLTALPAGALAGRAGLVPVGRHRRAAACTAASRDRGAAAYLDQKRAVRLVSGASRRSKRPRTAESSSAFLNGSALPAARLASCPRAARPCRTAPAVTCFVLSQSDSDNINILSAANKQSHRMGPDARALRCGAAGVAARSTHLPAGSSGQPWVQKSAEGWRTPSARPERHTTCL